MTQTQPQPNPHAQAALAQQEQDQVQAAFATSFDQTSEEYAFSSYSRRSRGPGTGTVLYMTALVDDRRRAGFALRLPGPARIRRRAGGRNDLGRSEIGPDTGAQLTSRGTIPNNHCGYGGNVSIWTHERPYPPCGRLRPASSRHPWHPVPVNSLRTCRVLIADDVANMRQLVRFCLDEETVRDRRGGIGRRRGSAPGTTSSDPTR